MYSVLSLDGDWVGGTVRNWHERKGGEVSGCWEQKMHFNVPHDLRQ